MALLGSGEQCYICGKDVDSDSCIEEDGKKFCCEKCEEHYEEEEKQKEETCQFC